jgi:methyltransferase (TIGR00027 family)
LAQYWLHTMEERPSLTAERVAVRRAVHQLLDIPPVFEDPLAVTILGPAQAAALHRNPRAFDDGELYSQRLRAFIAVRSRLAEDELASAFVAGVRQYVVLGAGLDTFAYRNPHRELRVLEVDHPATQQWKLRRLEEAGITVPSNVTFVAADLAHSVRPLASILQDAGLKTEEPSFFSWLGVTPYLEAGDVFLTLESVASLAPGGGGVVFDYLTPPESMTAVQRAAFEELSRRVARAGEPFRAAFSPEGMQARLRAMGFGTVRDLDGDALNAAYFSGRRDGLRVGGAGRILAARR